MALKETGQRSSSENNPRSDRGPSSGEERGNELLFVQSKADEDRRLLILAQSSAPGLRDLFHTRLPRIYLILAEKDRLLGLAAPRKRRLPAPWRLKAFFTLR